MMLTSVPPSLLHRVRDAAAYVHDLAQLGLDLLCPCEEGHGARLQALGECEDEPPAQIDAMELLGHLPSVQRLAGMVRLDVPA